MARFRMNDGTVVDTSNASQHWDEAERLDGGNQFSLPAGLQGIRQTLYRSQRGRFYIVHSSLWQGSPDTAEWVSNEEAALWLVLNEHDLPADLRKFAKGKLE